MKTDKDAKIRKNHLEQKVTAKHQLKTKCENKRKETTGKTNDQTTSGKQQIKVHKLKWKTTKDPKKSVAVKTSVKEVALVESLDKQLAAN